MAKTGGRKYGPKAEKKIEKVMHELEAGTLRSGGSGKKVTSRKQAIAIGISEARAEGDKVPPVPPRKRSAKSAATRATKRTTKRTAKAASTSRKRTAKKR
jgi:hypothetical protein